MAKKVAKMVKLQVLAGKATPAPPVGPALGQAGVNIMAFVKEFNERTAKQAGLVIPVEITVFEDRSFTLEKRAYHNSMQGILGMNTTASGEVGISRHLVLNPEINDLET